MTKEELLEKWMYTLGEHDAASGKKDVDNAYKTASHLSAIHLGEIIKELTHLAGYKSIPYEGIISITERIKHYQTLLDELKV